MPSVWRPATKRSALTAVSTEAPPASARLTVLTPSPVCSASAWTDSPVAARPAVSCSAVGKKIPRGRILTKGELRVSSPVNGRKSPTWAEEARFICCLLILFNRPASRAATLV